MKRLILCLLMVGFGPLFSSEHMPPPRVVYTTKRYIKVITPEGNNNVYVEVNATVNPEINTMRIKLTLYLNDIIIGEQNNEVTW